MGHVRVHNAEKSLSFCYLTKQRLINGLEDGVNERHGRHDDASPGYRPKFHVFTEKAYLWRDVPLALMAGDGQAPVQVVGCTNEGQVREGLGEVSQVFAT
jgi:hypothetical protein